MHRTITFSSFSRMLLSLLFFLCGIASTSFGQFWQPPTMNQPKDMILFRNSPQQNILFTGINDNSFFSTQTITFEGFSNDNNIINQNNFNFIYTQGSSQANFLFTPEPNKSGLVTIEIKLTDPDGSTSYFFDVLINNPPSFNITPTHTIDKDEKKQTVPDFAYNISDGDDNDGSQTLTFDVELDQLISGNLEFKLLPEIDAQGTLTYEVKKGKYGEASFLVTLDDGQSGNNTSGTLSFNIIVKDYVNTPPTFSLSGDVEDVEDFTETHSVTVTPDPVPPDDQDQEVTYTLDPSAVIFADIDFDPQTGNVLINAVPDRFGVQTFTITADDGEPENNTHSEEFTLTITSVDDPPTMDDVADILLDEGAGEQTVLLTGLSAGPYEPQVITDIIASSFDTSIIPDPEVKYTAPDTEGTLTFTPNPSTTGETTIQIFITDEAGKTLTKTFNVTIENLNDPPHFDPIPSPITLDEDDGTQTITITGINAGAGESQNLTFDVTNNNPDLITGVSLDYTSPSSTGTLSFSLSPNRNGTAVLTITLTDDGTTGGINQNSYSQDVDIIVNPVNDPPQFESEPVTNATTGEVYAYEIVANDPDNANLTISALTLPDWLDLNDNQDGTTTLSGTPAESDVGDHTVELQVQDGDGGTDEQNFTIAVASPNNPPTFTSTPPAEAVEKTYYEYSISVEDVDTADEVTITSISKPSWLVLTDNGNKTGLLAGTPPSGSEGQYDIVLRATDSRNGYTDQGFTLNVLRYNVPPRLTTIQQTTSEDQPILYSYNSFKSHFIDDDGDSLISIVVKNLPDHGQVKLGDVQLGENDVVKANDIKNLVYVPDENYNGFDFFNWNASDGRDYALNDGLASITINSEFDPPYLDNLEVNAIQYPFGQDSVLLTNNIEVFEYDNGRLESATITISENFVPGVDSLNATALGNTRIIYDGQNGILKIEGIDSMDVYQKILRSAAYYNKKNLSPNPLQPRSIAFRARDSEQSSNEVTRKIEFEDSFVELDIPNGFTPNDDLTNDTWNIQNIELYPDVEVKVFARNGSKVFESYGYQNEWDGQTTDGQELPAGVYYYFINLNKYNASYKGTITLLK